jgi:ferric-dicitrate binding protein FerR (iron transport regulator)
MPLPPEVDAWLGERTAEERRLLEKPWRLAEAAGPAMDATDQRRKAEVWQAISAMLYESEGEDMPRPRLRLIRGNAWQWVAAAAVIVILVGVAYMLRPVTVHAPNGEFAQANLPDGSVVHLNSGSSISYRAHFVGGRNLSLDGEAFFEVVTDDDAFEVKTFNARTIVLGTRFNVRARSNEPSASTSVAVESGRVRVESLSGSGDGVVLTRGLQSHVTESEAPSGPIAVALERALAWRDGGFAFNDQQFSTIFAEVERRFNVEIEAPDDLTRESFSFFLHSPRSAEDVVADLAQAKGLRYRETANGFEVYRP